ncbi:hypothetical protein A2U01_0089559, partial [Trifolium medium]|nr:hypothetical protein [Trifolium medium]
SKIDPNSKCPGAKHTSDRDTLMGQIQAQQVAPTARLDPNTIGRNRKPVSIATTAESET